MFSTGLNGVKFETKRCTTNSTETKKKVTRTKYMYLRFSDKSRYKDVYLINTSLVDRIYIFFFYLKKAAKTASINSQLPNFTNTLLLFIIERRQNFYPLQRLE